MGARVENEVHTQGTPSWLWSPFAQVRWSTVLTAVAIVLVITWQTRRPITAVVTALAWLSGFEILYQATGAVLHGWSLMTLTYTVTGTTGWLVAAYLLGVRPDVRLLVLFGIVWVVWIAAGYRSNMPDRIITGADVTYSWSDELLNVATKTVLAAALVVGLLRPKLKYLQVGTKRSEARSPAVHG